MAVVEDISPDIVAFWRAEGVYDGVELTSLLVVGWKLFDGMSHDSKHRNETRTVAATETLREEQREPGNLISSLPWRPSLLNISAKLLS